MDFQPDKLVFLDESSVNCGMTRIYGRAKSGKRVNEYVPDIRFERTSVISSIKINAEQAPFMFSGTLTGEVFEIYVREVLVPFLKEGDIIILDNLSAHKVKGALDPINKKGASVIFLPPYSPDFNPIELAWSKMKSIIRKLKPRSKDELVDTMKSAIEMITSADMYGWFAHCGYSFNV